MNRKRIYKIFKFFIFTSFITFLALYASASAGYFEYKTNKKVSLTNEQIREFEKEVNEGKNVDIKKYIDLNNTNYQNKVSKMGSSLSKITEKAVRKTISGSFKFLSKLIGE